MQFATSFSGIESTVGSSLIFCLCAVLQRVLALHNRDDVGGNQDVASKILGKVLGRIQIIVSLFFHFRSQYQKRIQISV
jgi:hypothetical protein